jgi:hypothetical protein
MNTSMSEDEVMHITPLYVGKDLGLRSADIYNFASISRECISLFPILIEI